jgi:hypothetical protein
MTGTERPVRIATVKVLRGFTVRLGLTNGTTKDVDLERFLRGPIFEPIRNDHATFESVSVDPRAGTIVWPNGADIDPDVLCEGLEPAEAPATAIHR